MAENAECIRMIGNACGDNTFLTCKESAVYEACNLPGRITYQFGP